MKKVFSALSVLAAVLAIGFGVSGCKSSVEESYSIGVESPANGHVTASAETAKAGDEITLTVSWKNILVRPGVVQKLDTIIVKDADGNSVTVTTVSEGEKYSFTMPASIVTVSVNTVLVSLGSSFNVVVPDTMDGTLTLETLTGPYGCIVSVSESFEQGSKLSFVYPGDTVTVTVKCTEEGYESSAISVKDADGEEVEITETAEKDKYTFIMPASDVTVSAVYYYEFDGTDAVVELPEGTGGTAGDKWNYVNFGDWPQTIKANSVTVDETRRVLIGAYTYFRQVLQGGANQVACTYGQL